ncbi:MAG: tetratricopeptide repeat protein [Acidobacteria bacterium]|nr:tetratricopeptide repeat protein [Acidobacteriota bacterium]
MLKRSSYFFGVLIITAALGLQISAQANPVRPSLRTIIIVTQPDSGVWLDGVLYGRTSESGELSISTVPLGRKMIRVRCDGFKEALKPLLPAQSGKVAIPLTKTTDPAELAFQEAERQTAIDRSKAVEAYERATKLRPAYADAYIGLARTLSEMGETERAEKAIAGARKAKPGFAEASVVEGRLLKSGGEDDKAIISYKRSLKESGGFQPEAYAGLGLIYKERAEEAGSLGDYVKENANYKEAAKYLALSIKQLSGAPDSVVMYQVLGLVYEQQKKPAQAIAVYEEFLRFFPSHAEAEAFQSFIVQLKKQQ